MNNTLTNVNTLGGGLSSPSTGLTPDALPEVQTPVLVKNSHTGVSTQNVPFATAKHWYTLRATYGQEKKAYDYIVNNKGTAFYPTMTTVKIVNGKKKFVEVSRLPNIFFAYGTEEEIKSFVYDNVNLPYLRFYYRHFHIDNRIAKAPLIVPDHQMKSLKIICTADAKDIIVSADNIQKFSTGQMVRIINGQFKGVIGKVARYHGQQRVAVIIDGVMTAVTAYVPSPFIEKI